MPMPMDFKQWTIADLAQLPNDGLQYELLDGVLHLSPWPTLEHQVVRGVLADILRAACAPDLFVLSVPVDWQPDRATSLQPDVLVTALDYLQVEPFDGLLALAVEVIAPLTRYRDTVLKRAKYAKAGVASFWLVDPARPSLLATELVDGRYEIVGEADGDQPLELQRPFPVTVNPAVLIEPWRRP